MQDFVVVIGRAIYNFSTARWHFIDAIGLVTERFNVFFSGIEDVITRPINNFSTAL